MAKRYISHRCPRCNRDLIQDLNTNAWYCPYCNPYFVSLPKRTSRIYYSDENGMMRSMSITSSKMSDNIPHPRNVQESVGTRGREYKQASRYHILLGDNGPKAKKHINEDDNESSNRKGKVKYRIASEKEIYNIISNWFVGDKKPLLSAVNRAFNLITDDLQQYFVKTLKEFVHNTGKKIQDDSPKKQKKNNKEKKAKKSTPATTTPKSQGSIRHSEAHYSSLGGTVQYNHPSRRKPKYGYARDRFGRIQERDHYVEGRHVNPYNSSNSLYDREDDSSSAYDGWD